jgi:hypothetical protein
MFLASVGKRPRPARTSKNLLVGGTGRVRLRNKFTQGLEIPMAVSDASKRFCFMQSASRTEASYRSSHRSAKKHLAQKVLDDLNAEKFFRTQSVSDCLSARDLAAASQRTISVGISRSVPQGQFNTESSLRGLTRPTVTATNPNIAS